MICCWRYQTPEVFDELWMKSDGEVLTGLWFEDSRDASKHQGGAEEKDLPIFQEVSKWLDSYFKGVAPDFTPKYKFGEVSPFRAEVWKILEEIPFGQTMTYGQIARRMAEARGIERMSAQAVGGAVGANPICLIVPCHRVVGQNGQLVGYGGGVRNKLALLQHEGVAGL